MMPLLPNPALSYSIVYIIFTGFDSTLIIPLSFVFYQFGQTYYYSFHCNSCVLSICNHILFLNTLYLLHQKGNYFWHTEVASYVGYHGISCKVSDLNTDPLFALSRSLNLVTFQTSFTSSHFPCSSDKEYLEE